MGAARGGDMNRVSSDGERGGNVQGRCARLMEREDKG